MIDIAITSTCKMAFEIIMDELPPLIERLKVISTIDIRNLENKIEDAKAPWTPERIPKMN